MFATESSSSMHFLFFNIFPFIFYFFSYFFPFLFKGKNKEKKDLISAAANGFFWHYL